MSVYTSTTLTIHPLDHVSVSEMPYVANFAPILPSAVTLNTLVAPTATIIPDNQLVVSDLSINVAEITDNDGTKVAAEKGVAFTIDPNTGVPGVTYEVTIKAKTDGGSELALIVPVKVQS
ncbi:MAG: hypothetical protein ACPGPS_04100 [Rubripirellula sp.]